ncbi:MAG TPA: hypothetical protein P5121_33530 [Caldilineaceae bacterium]|nr:hypothetical protein [Caldilineaceae bacterium]
MSQIIDQLLLQLSDPTQLIQALTPASDSGQAFLRTLIGAVYDMPFATLHQVLNVQVQRVVRQVPIVPLGSLNGFWQQTIPSYTRTDLRLEQQQPVAPLWIDLLVTLDLTLLLEVDRGEVESILTHNLADFNTLDEFRNQFRLIDLDAFMAKHGITTVAELKEASNYLITEIKLRTPPTFDPNDPANQIRFPLDMAILLRDTLDMTEALRAAKWLQHVADQRHAFQRELPTADVRSSLAPLLIFPAAVLNGVPFTAATLQSFFAAEQVLSLFVTPI